MTNFKTIQRGVICITAAALLGACATPPNPDGSAAAATDDDPCSVGRSTAVGVLAGAAIGALMNGSKGAAQGAAVGGIIGVAACVAINVKSRQTRTAEAADADYRRARGALPTEPTVVSYAPKLASAKVQRGQPMYINSSLELVNGSVKPVREVREELAIFNPDGTQFKSGTKPFSASTAGRYENSFEVKLPSAAPQGLYALKTQVYVNGNLAATRDLSTQVVWNGHTATLLASN